MLKNNTQAKGLEKAEEVFNFAYTAASEFENATLRRKREILYTIGSNLTLCNKKLNIQAHKPFSILQSGIRAIATPTVRFEPELQAVYKRESAAFSDANPMWLNLVNQVRTKIMESKEYVYIPDLAA